MKFIIAIYFLVCSLFSNQVFGCIEIEDVRYLLYTRLNPDHPYEISFGFTENLGVHLNPGPHTIVKFFLHGWVSHGNNSWVAPMKKAFLASDVDYIISVDWSEIASDINYFRVRRLTPNVGEHVAQLVHEMCENMGIPAKNFHLVGHSLGAHIAGFAGKKVLELVGEKIGRITALDPAGPGFNNADFGDRLDKGDASFVEAIHTNSLFLGYKDEIGHVDFWPNGGFVQNGCDVINAECSHNRAPVYFFESIENEDFPAWECGSQNEFERGECFGNTKIFMGNDVEGEVTGNFYLSTKSESPFGIPEYNIFRTKIIH